MIKIDGKYMSKYKYYFRKPKSEIVKDILYGLVMVGAITIAATSPYFLLNLRKTLKWRRKYKKEKVQNAFNKLRRDGCIEIKKINHQIYITLTEEGKRKAGRLQIDALKIKKPKNWDGKWRIVIFDISQLQRFYRDVFRGKLKELDFYPLQKSVWIHPFDCRDEIELLKDFLGLTDREIRLIVAQDIGKADWLEKKFQL